MPIAKYEKDLLKSVAKLCSCNFLEAKRIVEVTGKEFEPMDAIDTLKLKEQIEEVEIPYVITPTDKVTPFDFAFNGTFDHIMDILTEEAKNRE